MELEDSYAQEKPWFLDQLQPENSFYNPEVDTFPQHATDLDTLGARSCYDDYISDPFQKNRNLSGSQYAAVVLSSIPEIRELGSISRRFLPHDDTMLDPEFFLASISKGWAPHVVAIFHKSQLVGILYTKERVIGPVRTGVVYCDVTFGDTVLATDSHQQNVFRVAVETLLASPNVYGIRLRLLCGTDEMCAVRNVIASRPLDVRHFRIRHNESRLWKYHAHLALADTYERFLEKLGRTTRHNFRYYRRRFEKSGHAFVDTLTISELRSAAAELVAKSKFQSHLAIESSVNMVAVARRPLAVGLKHKNGEWLGVIGGWYRAKQAVLFCQYNADLNFGNDSLSVVLRGYLIESLIRQDCKELVIVDGTAPPLSRYSTYRSSIAVYLDIPTYRWRAVRLYVSAIRTRLPRRLADAAEWIC